MKPSRNVNGRHHIEGSGRATPGLADPPYPGRSRGGRRRARRGRGRGAAALAGALVCAAVLAAAGVRALDAAAGEPCAGPVLTLRVAVAPALAPALRPAADRFGRSAHVVDGACARAVVRAEDPGATAARLESGRGERPDVWIPDSAMWPAQVQRPGALRVTATSVARTPLVAGLTGPDPGAGGTPSWRDLLVAAGSLPGAARPSLRLRAPDPGRDASGLGLLMITHGLLRPERAATGLFTSVVRSVREHRFAPPRPGEDPAAALARALASSPPRSASPAHPAGRTADAAATAGPAAPAEAAPAEADGAADGVADGAAGGLAGGADGRHVAVVASEQAFSAYARSGRPPVRVLRPAGAGLDLDHPYVVTAATGAARRAALLLERELTSAATRAEVRAAGFRTGTGEPPPAAAEVRQVVQAWWRLTLTARILSLIDVSGSMAEKVPGSGISRMEAIVRVSRAGLRLQPDDTELGQWVFSTRMDGRRDWRENVSLGPLGRDSRRQRILGALDRMRPKPDGDTGLYDTVLAAFEHMTRTYRPNMVHTVLLFTDGRNDDADGPTLRETLDRLREMYDPRRPVQIVMVGFGPGVERAELERIAEVTRGGVHVARTTEDIERILLNVTARRVCAPDC
ncbi:substrate-binding domain-containing protein [Bailinhaonella thermotolerans]|nr:substrate-binding domain-containing protein [Bailinhaonella thermotolerans]